MQLSRNRVLVLLAIANVALLGWDEGGHTISRAAAQETPVDVAESEADVRHRTKDKSATLILGEQSFTLDVVVCIGTSTASVVASDSQKRRDYPTLTVKTYDPAMTGGRSINTASALFEREGYGEHWMLHEGIVEKDGNLFTAEGTLKGSRLLPRGDGTRESALIDGESILPFKMRIQC